MLSRDPSDSLGIDLRLLDAVRLFRVCADDRENAQAWAEFMRRYAGRIKYFISGTLRQYFGSYSDKRGAGDSGGAQESDLFQNIIVRLVENDCAVMQKFSGGSEADLLAYLAVISRSSVLDSLRKSRANKRRPATVEVRESFLALVGSSAIANPEYDRKILAGELLSFARQTIQSYPGHISERDQLVFDLHFFDGLSFSQIAQCKGIKLSKAGVEKLLKRVVGRVQSLASSGKSEETLQ
jgi:RNA polymerase sigma factor (sigma-70 family)